MGDVQTWEPIRESDLAEFIVEAEARMEPAFMTFWERIRVRPVKWQLPPWGDQGGGFWVVAVMGQLCVWYNDIEAGFEVNPFEEFGSIVHYRCNQIDGLDDSLRRTFEALRKDLVEDPGAGAV